MKLYRLRRNILLLEENTFYSIAETDWDELVNREELYLFLQKLIKTDAEPVEINRAEQLIDTELIAPVGRQDIWAAGVTYFKSKEARIEESKVAGGGNFYDRVYSAHRPELFFKSTPARVVGCGASVRIRRDSEWNVPEPELTLFINSRGQIQGYSIGNDMSSRSIEGENPLYLPQAKTYDGSASIGPCLYIPSSPLPSDTLIEMEIWRENKEVFCDSVPISRMKRGHEELADFLFLECAFPYGCYLMTGTGIVPSQPFTLMKEDEIRIRIEPIGILTNIVS